MEDRENCLVLVEQPMSRKSFVGVGGTGKPLP